jgi:hypothetical protein
MKIVARSSVYSTTAASSYQATTNQFTPGPNNLLIACLGGASTPLGLPLSVQGAGLTWTRLPLANDLISTTHRSYIYYAFTGSSPTSGVVQVNWGGVNLGGGYISVVEVKGVFLPTPASSAWCRQALSHTPGAATSGGVTMAAPRDKFSMPLFWAVHLANEGKTPKSGWTEIHDGNFNTPATGSEIQIRALAVNGSGWDERPRATWSTSALSFNAALELLDDQVYRPVNNTFMGFFG